MIELIEEKSQICGFNLLDIYSVRILSLLDAYGCKYPFVRFYRQTDESENITAIISYLDYDYGHIYVSKAKIDTF